MPDKQISITPFYEHQWGVLAGVDQYDDDGFSNLSVCVSDVQKVYETLIAADYSPERLRLLLSSSEPNQRPTRAEFLSSISSVAQSADKNDLLLVYFSGHGYADGNRAYLLPMDARSTSIHNTAVEIEAVKQIIQNSSAKAKVLILDACHSGAQIGKAPLEMSEEFIQNVFKDVKGMVILASCQQKQVSWEWREKGQSVFTYYLIEGLQGAADFDKKGFVTEKDINRYLSDKVKSWAVQSGRVQIPTMESAVSGEIVLVELASSQKTDTGKDATDPRQQWVKELKFKRDPFRYSQGDQDKFLDEYFYFGMKHFYDVFDETRLETTIVLGPPGSGKSSMRNVISLLCSKKKVFDVVYNDFGPLIKKREKGEKIHVEDHVAQLLKTAIRTLAKESKNLGKEDASSQDSERYACNQLWLYVDRYEDDDSIKSELERYLKPDMLEGKLPENDARELLRRFSRHLIRLFKYQSIYVLVDPDEETSADVLLPLLSNRPVINLSEENVVFKFFLGTALEKEVREIPWITQEWNRVYTIEWQDNELGMLLEKRLWQSSGGGYDSLSKLSPETDKLDDRVIRLANHSPRTLIDICSRLFSEHSRNWTLGDTENLFITQEEADEVLRPYEERFEESVLEQLIAQGEGQTLEFKSTMRYNLGSRQRDKKMDREIAETICGFLNTDGGTLLIGVENNGNVLGVEDDFSTLGKGEKEDLFKRAFTDIIKDLFTSPLSPDYYTSDFSQYQDKLVYVVKVEKAIHPVFCLFEGKQDFCIRNQASTQKLDPEPMWKYISEHFKDK